MEKIINEILLDMEEYLSVQQSKKLQEVLINRIENGQKDTASSEENVLELFISAKDVEGCSKRTLGVYRNTVQKLLDTVKKPVRQITTEDIRKYLADYQRINNCGKATIDNIRRNASGFFSWLEEEDLDNQRREGYNLFRKMEGYQKNHLLFLHNSEVPATNNLSERMLRDYKREQKQAVTFRSFESIENLCNGKGLLL